MATKFNIQGDLIGTTADNVEYSKQGWQNATNAKTALDDLHERLSDVENGEGGSTHVESAADIPYINPNWDDVTNVEEALDDVQSRLSAIEEGEGEAVGPKLYIYGDSIVTDNTNTYSQAGQFSESMASKVNCGRVLARLCNASSYMNLAQSGGVMGGMLEKVYNQNAGEYYAPRSNTDFIMIMIGINNVNSSANTDSTVGDASVLVPAALQYAQDPWHRSSNQAWPTDSNDALNATYLGMMLRFILCCRLHSPNAKILVCTPCWNGYDQSLPADDNDGYGSGWGKRKLNLMRAGLKDICDGLNDEHVVFVNTFDCGIDTDNYLSYFRETDSTHPKREGSEKIGKYIYEHGILGKPISNYYDFPYLSVKSSAIVNVATSGNANYAPVITAPVGGSGSITLKLDGTRCGDITHGFVNSATTAPYFSFSAETIEADSIRNVTNKKLTITFTPPAGAEVGAQYKPYLALYYSTPDGRRFNVGTYLYGRVVEAES